MKPSSDNPEASASCCRSSSCQTPAAGAEEAVLNSSADGSVERTLRVAGMDCGEEVAAVERALKPLPDVRECA